MIALTVLLKMTTWLENQAPSGAKRPRYKDRDNLVTMKNRCVLVQARSLMEHKCPPHVSKVCEGGVSMGSPLNIKLTIWEGEASMPLEYRDGSSEEEASHDGA